MLFYQNEFTIKNTVYLKIVLSGHIHGLDLHSVVSPKVDLSTKVQAQSSTERKE